MDQSTECKPLDETLSSRLMGLGAHHRGLSRALGLALGLFLASTIALWGSDCRAATAVALTFDDLPLHGPTPPGQAPIPTILTVLRKHHVPPTYGFLNARALQDAPQLQDALRAWVAAGHELGNHTFSHADLGQVSAADFLADVARNEPTLRTFAGTDAARWKVFRYPYLRKGRDLTTRQAVQNALLQRGYRIAEVTIDFNDWAFNPPYARCLARNDKEALALLQTSYIGDAESSLRWSIDAAERLYHRPVAHILLLHVGAFGAVMLETLLTRLEALGVHFITLDQALRDPIYAKNPLMPGGKLFDQVYAAQQAVGPPYPPPRLAPGVLESLCR